MAKQPGANVNGRPFDQITINTIWQKAQVIQGYDSNEHRKDRCGAWIKRSSYGTTGDYGWEVDHMKPVAKGGTDDTNNLQPLH